MVVKVVNRSCDLLSLLPLAVARGHATLGLSSLKDLKYGKHLHVVGRFSKAPIQTLSNKHMICILSCQEL